MLSQSWQQKNREPGGRVNRIKKPLINKVNKPKVNIFIGRVKKIINGFIKIFIIPKTTETTIAVKKLSTWTPGNK